MMVLDLLAAVLAPAHGRTRHIVVAGIALLAISGPALAGTLVYTPTNPTFGGNPLNGSYLFNNAQVQNQYTQSPGGAAGAGMRG